jgi:hypothetical protein
MSIGNFGAAPGAQPAAGPTGAPIFANQGTNSSAVIGAAGDIAPYGGPTYFNSSFEALMAAASRGEISLNQQYAVAGLGGIGNANGNPTLMQAISQGVPQNGTNGIGVQAGPAGGAGNGVGQTTQVSGNGGLGSTVMAASGVSATGFGGAVLADAKQMANAPAVALASPAQYGGN